MLAPTRRNETVESVVIEIVADLIQDWGLELSDGVSAATLLVEDLEFASVDIIQLCVALEQHYERKLGFADLLMVDGSYVKDLAIKQIAQFVENKLTRAAGNRS